MRHSFDRVLKTRDSNDVDMRLAAYIVAVKTVADATDARSIYP
jgi:glutamate dehydrogenase/leucine dehydrogenase